MNSLVSLIRALFGLFSGKIESESTRLNSELSQTSIKSNTYTPPLDLKAYLSASGRYPDRIDHSELTETYKSNAASFIVTVNRLLKDLGIEKVEVSSGFRPNSANQAAGGATKSYHLRCLAVDFVDSDGKLDELLLKNQDLLEKYNLWQEHPDATPGWAHIDAGSRNTNIKREYKRVFRP